MTEGTRKQAREVGGLSTHAATRLAWSLWVACVVLIALSLVLDFLRTDMFVSYSWQIRIHNRSLYPLYAVLTGMLSLVYPTIGALIVSRLPRNPIGWIFCGVGLLYQLHHFALAYANYAVAENFALPSGEYAAWFSTWIGFAGLILAGVFLMLLFPDGRLLSGWWQIVAWTAVLGAPIEEAFSKIKTLVRKAGARVREAIGRASATVTPEDAAGWFAHADYWPQDQPL